MTKSFLFSYLIWQMVFVFLFTVRNVTSTDPRSCLVSFLGPPRETAHPYLFAKSRHFSWRCVLFWFGLVDEVPCTHLQELLKMTYHKLSGLINRNVLYHNSGGSTSGIKVLAGSHRRRAAREGSVPGLSR